MQSDIDSQVRAEEYHVDDVTIFDIVRWKTWKTNPNEHLPQRSSNLNEF